MKKFIIAILLVSAIGALAATTVKRYKTTAAINMDGNVDIAVYTNAVATANHLNQGWMLKSMTVTYDSAVSAAAVVVTHTPGDGHNSAIIAGTASLTGTSVLYYDLDIVLFDNDLITVTSDDDEPFDLQMNLAGVK